MVDTEGQDQGHFKDEILNALAGEQNIAQFASFAPSSAKQRFSHVRGYAPNHEFPSVRDAAEALLNAADEPRVNIRSYEPDNPRSREFIYGLQSASDVESSVHRLATSGLTTIVNETIDVADGGVSGVAFGNVVEVAPDDTPRCVEKPGVAGFPRQIGLAILQSIYGFQVDLPTDLRLRTEFSLHPLRRGLRHQHTVVWEQEASLAAPSSVEIRWPNRLSSHVGDKTFGLLVADALGFPVPRTMVLSRRVAPFSFGHPTDSAETWLRTAPFEQEPGVFTTQRGWRDPFILLQEEDPEGNRLAAVLVQHGIEARHSGAAAHRGDGTVVVEGRPGTGEGFMLGQAPPEELPEPVLNDVEELLARVSESLGSARLEWVHDGERTWIVQLHSGGITGVGPTIWPGTGSRYREFDVRDGLPALRELIEQVVGTGEGIELIGGIGLTSHFGDVLRRAKVPSRIRQEGT